jgi:dUTP pyrophosphatase
MKMVDSLTPMVVMEIFKLPHALEGLPQYATEGSAGMDLQAAIETPVTLEPMQRELIQTGLIFHIPSGYEIQLRARSGLSIKHGITLINGIGTIDADYRHEVKVALINLSQTPYTIQPGERICQMVLSPVSKMDVSEVYATAVMGSRTGGFGSTGQH